MGNILFMHEIWRILTLLLLTQWGECSPLPPIYLVFTAALGPGVYSASNRNEYQKQKNNVSGEYSAAGAWGWQPYRHLSADCLDISQPYMPPRPVMEIALLLQICLHINKIVLPSFFFFLHSYPTPNPNWKCFDKVK
jgi:hypothetical protein